MTNVIYLNQMLLAAEHLKIIVAPTPHVPQRCGIGCSRQSIPYAASPLMNGNPEMSSFCDGGNLFPRNTTREMGQSCRSCLDVIKLGKYEFMLLPNVATEGFGELIQNNIASLSSGIFEKTCEGGWSDIDPLDSYRALFNGIFTLSRIRIDLFTCDNQLNDEYGYNGDLSPMPGKGGG